MNKAYISNDIEKAKEVLEKEYQDLIIFEDNELKLPMVKEIKEIAYKTSKNKQTILIKAINLRIEAQNALLKILEETPDNLEFLILTTSKYALLDTIRSRVEIKTLNFEIPEVEVDINIDRLTTKDIYDILKKDISKQQLKQYIIKIFKQLKNPNQRVLDNFELAIKLVDLNSDKQALLSLILLSIRENNGNL